MFTPGILTRKAIRVEWQRKLGSKALAKNRVEFIWIPKMRRSKIKESRRPRLSWQSTTTLSSSRPK
jgi:hypothetical protein